MARNYIYKRKKTTFWQFFFFLNVFKIQKNNQKTNFFHIFFMFHSRMGNWFITKLKSVLKKQEKTTPQSNTFVQSFWFSWHNQVICSFFFHFYSRFFFLCQKLFKNIMNTGQTMFVFLFFSSDFMQFRKDKQKEIHHAKTRSNAEKKARKKKRKKTKKNSWIAPGLKLMHKQKSFMEWQKKK